MLAPFPQRTGGRSRVGRCSGPVIVLPSSTSWWGAGVSSGCVTGTEMAAALPPSIGQDLLFPHLVMPLVCSGARRVPTCVQSQGVRGLAQPWRLLPAFPLKQDLSPCPEIIPVFPRGVLMWDWAGSAPVR